MAASAKAIAMTATAIEAAVTIARPRSYERYDDGPSYQTYSSPLVTGPHGDDGYDDGPRYSRSYYGRSIYQSEL